MKLIVQIVAIALVARICSLEASAGRNSYVYLSDKLIQEEIPIGSLIVDIAEELENVNSNNNNRQQSEIGSDSHENQHYTFLEDIKSSTENTYFLLDSITGRLTSKRYLDRESMCLNKHCVNNCQVGAAGVGNATEANCVMNVRVLIIPSYRIVSLNVIVQDINDNKPHFRIDYMSQSVAENVPVGHRIPVDVAYDPDVGKNTIQTYELGQPTDYFELVRTNVHDSPLCLTVKRPLDRETTAQFNLTIIACDGGQPSNCGQLKLTLNVVDINDNNPKFRRDVYSFSVVENSPRGTILGQIDAFDLDAGSNGQVRYKLLNPDEGYFHLDELTGVLTLERTVDFEREQMFTLRVEARDSGVGSLPAYANVEVRVVDLNDNSPEISVSFLNSIARNETTNGTYLYLAENIEPGKFIAHVSISDLDSDENGQIEWRIMVNDGQLPVEDDERQLLKVNRLNANSFTLHTGARSDKLFDREQFESIRVSIVACDNGRQPHANTAYFNFTIILLDENDNSPQFDRSIYELNVNENNQLDQLIHKFEARDADQGEYGRVTYSLEGADFVFVEPVSGYLRARRMFDREQSSSYEFHVVATDNDPKQARSTRVKCRLNIIDQNDNAPIISHNTSYGDAFNATHLMLRVDENVPVNTQLVKFTCSDRDAGENARTKFLLLNSFDLINPARLATGSFNELISFKTADLTPFKLTDDGRLIVSKKLDRELHDTHEYSLVCYDNPSATLRLPTGRMPLNHLNSTLRILIRLNDVNDNCPRSLNKTDLKSFKSLYLNRDVDLMTTSNNTTSSERLLFSEQYVDDDQGKNARLRFQLETHTDLFALNVTELSSPSSPQIYSMKVLARANLTNAQLKMGKYVIKVKISDLGNPSCIKSDSYLLYVGDNRTRNQADLIEKINSVFSSKNGPNQMYVNDANEDEADANNGAGNYDLSDDDDDDDHGDDDDEDDSQPDGLDFIKKSRTTNGQQLHQQPLNVKSSSAWLHFMFKNNDYLILIGLVSTLVLIGSIFSFVGLLFFCRRLNRADKNRRSTHHRKFAIDTIKVKNDGGGGTSPNSDASALTSAHDEMNNLLGDSDQNVNRLSLSLKSTDQSQSADSVVSNITYARDTTCSSSNSSQIGEHGVVTNAQHEISHINEIIAQQAAQKYCSKTFYRDSYNLKTQNNRKYYDTCQPNTSHYGPIQQQPPSSHHHRHQQQQQQQPYLTSFPQRVNNMKLSSSSNVGVKLNVQNQANMSYLSSSQAPYAASTLITPTSTDNTSDMILLPPSTVSCSSTSSSSSSTTSSSDASPNSLQPKLLSTHGHASNYAKTLNPIIKYSTNRPYQMDDDDEEEDEDEENSRLVVKNNSYYTNQTSVENSSTLNNRYHQPTVNNSTSTNASCFLRSSAV